MRRLFYFLIAASLIVVPQLAAGTLALTFTGGTEYAYVTDPRPNTIGWEFELSAAVTVTSLGFYDVDGDGLVADHDVAIWDASTVEVAYGLVTNADPLDQGFRWVSISPVTLGAGIYRIGALAGNAPAGYVDACPGDPSPPPFTGDCYFSGTAARLTAGPVTYNGGVYGTGGFVYPDTIGYTNNGRFGPDFQFEESGVPEPSTVGTVLIGFLAAAALRRRRAF